MRTAFQNASVVCAEISVSPPRPTAAEIITGNSLPSCIEHFADGDQRRLGVQRIKNRLHQEQVHASRHESAHLLSVGCFDLIECDHPKAWIIGVGRVRQ